MMAGTIKLKEPQCSNIKEVFRHIATETDQDVINLNRFGAETLVNWYLAHYGDDFDEKDNGQIVFLHGDSVKSSATEVDQEEIQEQIEDDDGKLTFKMSDME
jgi:hypothetical protein